MNPRPERPASHLTSNPPPLALDGIRRRFGARTVVDQVSLTVGTGELHLIVGPNGSGKSTLGRLAAGLLKHHGGSVGVFGQDPRLSAEARRRVGYLGHQPALYDELTPLENLGFAARLFGLPNDRGRLLAALGRFGIEKEVATPVRLLSRGTVQRVALAKSVLHEPALVLWDEPLTGLDGPSLDRLINILRSRSDLSIVVTSHDLAELWQLDAKVHVLVAGRLRFSVDTRTPLTEFRRRYAEAMNG